MISRLTNKTQGAKRMRIIYSNYSIECIKDYFFQSIQWSVEPFGSHFDRQFAELEIFKNIRDFFRLPALILDVG